MNINIPLRNSVRILLINDTKELLLMYIDNTSTTNKYHYGGFWCTVGGEIEAGESLIQAAKRELQEETGLNEHDVTFGPIVWFSDFNMPWFGTITQMKQWFIVAHTKSKKVTMDFLTPEEQKMVKTIKWFSLATICHTQEIIYPTLLKKYLPEILAKRYPDKPIQIEEN